MKKQRNGMVTQSEESITLNNVLPAFLTTTADPSHSFRMTINIFSHYDILSSNRHSARGKNTL